VAAFFSLSFFGANKAAASEKKYSQMFAVKSDETRDVENHAASHLK